MTTRGRPSLEPGEHGEIRITTLPSGSYQARVIARRTNGEYHRPSASGKSAGAAKRALNKKLRNAPTPGGGAITAETRLEDAWAEWLKYARAAGKPSSSSLRTYQAAFKTTLGEMGKLRLRELSTPVLADHIDALAENTPTKARHAVVALRHVSKRAMRLGALNHDPVAGVPWPARREPSRHTLDDGELRLLFSLIREHHAAKEADGKPTGTYMGNLTADALLLTTVTGLRIGEVLALQWPEVDLRSGRVRVTATMVASEDGIRRGDTTKGRRPRTLALPTHATNMLRRRWHERKEGYKHVFAHSRGDGPVLPSSFRTRLRRILDDSPLEGFTPRTLRRTLATRVRDTTGDAGLAAAMLGHTAPDITQMHYLAERSYVDATTALEDWLPDLN